MFVLGLVAVWAVLIAVVAIACRTHVRRQLGPIAEDHDRSFLEWAAGEESEDA